MPSNLAITITHTVSFLTSPLIASYPSATIRKLQLTLEANLTALYAPTWVPKEPFRGSGRRSLILSPDCLPPRPIYSACVATNIQWFQWMSLFGNQTFDLFVDPGCVSVRYQSNGKLLTVWHESRPAKPSPHPVDVQRAMRMGLGTQAEKRKTLAQQLLEDDRQADDQLFAMIADEINDPTWMTPINAYFPPPVVRPLSPVSTTSTHSRCSSRSSNSSSGFSHTSAHSSATSVSFISTPESKERTQSRRERARQARVFIDTSKKEVTPYDGGKTTVLTGGVMLGGAQRGVSRTNKACGDTWHSSRA